MNVGAGRFLAFALAASLTTLAQEAHAGGRLPIIGPAPDFALVSQDGAKVSLADYRGRVVAVTFIYTACPDICPTLTDKMARIQDALGADFGSKFAFVSITLDPAHDTPEALKEYARAFNAKPAGWAFLTGTQDAIRNVEQSYGVFAARAPDGTINHTMLTSLIDPEGMLRVQYLGYRFDQEEFRSDLLTLASEPE